MNIVFRLKQVVDKKAYSLLEIVVSLAIIAVMLVMLTNVMIISLSVAAKTAARANVREEISNILSNIKRDIRNSQVINHCVGENDEAVCEGVLAMSGKFSWKLCDNEDGTKGVCKYDDNGSIQERSPEYMTIDKLFFDIGFDKTLDKRTILVTIVGSYRGGALNISNVVQQTAISTRNYPGVSGSTGSGSAPVRIPNFESPTLAFYCDSSLSFSRTCSSFYTRFYD
ncbi:type II secretion system protein [Candidatus Dojkabacteria bacterium]|nr:type II secretion system protein [Candidatus Dojkabacteria bacterium]